ENPEESAAWDHPAYVAEVERVVAEGFLRSNAERLFGRNGIPVPLPKVYHWFPTRTNVDSALTVRAFLLEGDQEEGSGAQSAAGESYREHDTKLTSNLTRTKALKPSLSVGPRYREGATQ